LHPGSRWTEFAEWTERLGDWKIYWAGTLEWTADTIVPYGRDRCVRLTYTAQLRPQVWDAPAWAKGSLGRPYAETATEGVAIFDPVHGRMVSNTFSYEGLLHIPIQNLGRIPWALRVGRGVRGVPGTIVLRLQNKIDVRKN
jgi:hypothetical protein